MLELDEDLVELLTFDSFPVPLITLASEFSELFECSLMWSLSWCRGLRVTGAGLGAGELERWGEGARGLETGEELPEEDF